MAKVSYLPDKVAPPVDTKLEEIHAVAVLAGKPIRLRIQPDLYHPERQGYESWAGLAWTLDLDDIEEGRRFREALGRFMAAFAADGATQAELIVQLERLG